MCFFFKYPDHKIQPPKTKPGEVHSLKLSPNLRDAHEPRDDGGKV